MSSLGQVSNQNVNHINREKVLLLNTIDVMDEEKENTLMEVLRCYVCLELPKGKQVRICEGGHHCCLTCHKKIKVCGICRSRKSGATTAQLHFRGRLLEARNFVVEQLVTKLGPILGLPKNDAPPAESARHHPPGLYQCLHHCPTKVPAFQMLTHLRNNHSVNLLEKVRSNSYFGRFAFKLNLHFDQNENYVWSTHVVDMGLFTVVLDFLGTDFLGCVRMLAEKSVASLFRYQLALKIPCRDSESSLEFSMTNCQVCTYGDDIENISLRGNCLRILSPQLVQYCDVGSAATVVVSIWQKRERVSTSEGEQRESIPLVCVPERHLHLEDNRKMRRNRNRNMRRSRLKLLKKQKKSEEGARSLTKKLSNLAL